MIQFIIQVSLLEVDEKGKRMVKDTASYSLETPEGTSLTPAIGFFKACRQVIDGVYTGYISAAKK